MVGTKLRNGHFEAGIFVCSLVKVFALKDWVRALKFFETGKQLIFLEWSTIYLRHARAFIMCQASNRTTINKELLQYL